MAFSFHMSLRPVDIRALSLLEFDLYAHAVDSLTAKRGGDNGE